MWKQCHEADEELATGSQAYKVWYPFLKRFSSIVEGLNKFKHCARYAREGKVS
jgi:hypothetical protein